MSFISAIVLFFLFLLLFFFTLRFSERLKQMVFAIFSVGLFRSRAFSRWLMRRKMY